MRRVPLGIKIAVPLVGLLATVVALVVGIGILKAWWSLPFNAVKPVAAQPIEFPHDVHTQQLGIDCLFCHRTANIDEAASIPAVQQCMFCHQVVTGATDAAKERISRLTSAAENNEPINWSRVHRLPDSVQFVHSAHVSYFSEQMNVAPSQACQFCHGDVTKMKVAEQVRNLKMRDCLDCHRGGYLEYLSQDAQEVIRQAVNERRTAPPPVDCFQCHY